MLPGVSETQVSVVQYGAVNTLEVMWKDAQEKQNLLNLVDHIPRRTAAAPALGTDTPAKAPAARNHSDARRPAALPVCRFRPAVRRAEVRVDSQRRTGRRGQGRGDAGDRRVRRRCQRGGDGGAGSRWDARLTHRAIRISLRRGSRC